MSTQKSVVEALQEQAKEYTVQIDNRTFVIKKLKFGGQAKLAGLITSAMEGMKMQLNLDPSEGQKSERKLDLNLSAIIAKAPQLMPEIVAVGLGLPLSEVENFENGQQVSDAFVKILEVNPVGDIVGKSLALLENINL